MTKVYTQHDAAFARVSSYAVLRDGKPVATIAFKFPADGAGRLYAYIHWLGCEMVRGAATGYDYDKRTAACASAMSAVRSKDGGWRMPVSRADHIAAVADFCNALAADNGYSFDRALRDAGFVVFQTV